MSGSCKSWCSDKGLLIAGMLLPAALLAFFFIAKAIAPEPPNPSENFVYSVDNYQAQKHEFSVKDGALSLTYKTSKEDYENSKKKPTLFLYDVKAKASRELTVPDVPSDLPATLAVASLSGVKLDGKETSADGFKLKEITRRSRPFVVDMFAGGRLYGCVLAYNDMQVPLNIDQYCSNVKFLGWVKEGKADE